MKVKKLDNFLNENYNIDDFIFNTDLKSSDIYMTNYGTDFDDFNIIDGEVHWELKFDWMGDAGIDYSIEVTKVIVRYEGITYDENDEETIEEKELIIDDSDKIEIEMNHKHSQFIANNIDIDVDSAIVTF